MFKLEVTALKSLLNQAKIKADESKDFFYASYTQKVPYTNLVDVFKQAHKTEMNRSFWHSDIDKYTLVGIGETAIISDEIESSEMIGMSWNQIIEKTIVHNPHKAIRTGMIAIGGLAFDPKKNKTRLWKNYPSHELTVPKVLFTQEESTYLTINLQVNTTSDIEEMIKEISNLMHELLNEEKIQPVQSPIVKEKNEIKPDEWKDTVKLAIEAIDKGVFQKVVLAREMRLTLTEQVIVGDVLEKLIKTQPNSYVFAIEKGTDCFIGATPQRLVKIWENKLLSVCLAGTAKRGETCEEDKLLAENLLNDKKNREEHEHVVQTIRENTKSLCKNIDIPKDPVIYPLRNLQHLYTPVTAELEKETSIIDVVRKLHPTPALGGLPNETALGFIREHEYLDRGWYGAPIGWMDANLNGEFAVAIRSGLVQGNEVSLFAGGGIIKDADPELEYKETNLKFSPILEALERVEGKCENQYPI